MLYAQKIESILFDGLTVTKEDYLRKIITLKEGRDFDSLKLEEDVFLLRNLNLFFDVQATVVSNQTSVDILFSILEAKYLYPIIQVSGFKGQLKLGLGVNHINFLGRAQSFGAMYQYYDRHSFSVFYTAPRHANNKTGHEVAISKYSTIEPLYFEDTMSNFNFDNYSVSAGGFFWLTNYIRSGIGGQYMYEMYEQRDEAFLLSQKSFHFNKYQIRSSINLNKVENLYEKQDGIKSQIYCEYIHTQEYPDASFTKFLSNFTWYKKTSHRGNLATKVHFGISTNKISPFSPFVLDGLINVRGIGNRIMRGTAELVLNAEYRYTIWKNKLIGIQPAIFADYGTLREPGKKIESLFDNSDLHLFTGGGIRLHFNAWYKTCIRLDYSFNPSYPTMGGFTFGFGQFF